jgi:hypothetical protein
VTRVKAVHVEFTPWNASWRQPFEYGCEVYERSGRISEMGVVWLAACIGLAAAHFALRRSRWLTRPAASRA